MAVQTMQIRDIDEEIGYGTFLEKMRRIKLGNSYALEVEKSDYALKLWDDCNKNGFRKKFDKGHAIYSRTRPVILEGLGMFKKKDARWFTTNYFKDEICLGPTNIAGISSALKGDIADEKAILVDGMEYLSSQNNFDIVLRLVHHINETVQGSKAAIVWSYDPIALGQKEWHNLKKDATNILEL